MIIMNAFALFLHPFRNTLLWVCIFINFKFTLFITINSNLDTKKLFSHPKKALGTFFLKHLTNRVPNVKFGTKWLQKTM